MRPTMEIAADYEGIRIRLECLREHAEEARVHASYARTAIENAERFPHQAPYWIEKARVNAHHAASCAHVARHHAYRLDYLLKG